MSSDAGDWTCLQPGFPIRKSSDHSLVIDSPRHIADSYVLHRFLVPRHPPCALKNLTTKMLASTVQFSKHQPRHHNHPEHTVPDSHSRATTKKPTTNPSNTHQDTQRPTPQTPNSAPHATPHQHPTHFPHPTQKQDRTHAPEANEAPLLIDVPPSSNYPSTTHGHSKAAC